MPRFQKNDNFIDKTFTVIADIVLKVLPASKQEKEAFAYLIENVSNAILSKKKLKYPIISPEETMLYLEIIDKWNLNIVN